MQEDKELSKKSFSFAYRERLHSQRDFNKVFKKGLRLDNKAIKILALKKDDNPICRLGLVTSKKVGKAVIRNKTKRQLREIFRTNKHSLQAGTDLIFILKPKTATLEFKDLQKTVLEMLTKAGLYKGDFSR